MSDRKVHFEFCLDDKNHMSHRDLQREQQQQLYELPRQMRPQSQQQIGYDPNELKHAASTSTTSTETTTRMRNHEYNHHDIYHGSVDECRTPKEPPHCLSWTISAGLFAILGSGIVAVLLIMLLPESFLSNDAALADATTKSLTCGCPETCKPRILNSIVDLRDGVQDDYTCRDRIQFLMTEGMDELQACEYASDEFPSVCGRGCRPSNCDEALDDETLNMTEGRAESVDDIDTIDVCPQLIWQDEFDGSSLNTSNWSHQKGDGCAENLCGWGNGELQTYQAENVFITNGTLIIQAARNDSTGAYTSGRIRTAGLVDFRYGYVEASIQVPRGQGLWSAFWALPTDEVYGKWPKSGELDMMENVGHEPDTVHGSIHYANTSMSHDYLGEKIQLPGGEVYADRFHDYAINWEKDNLQWLVDGAQYSQITPGDIDSDMWPFDQRFHLLLNVAIGGGWTGSPGNTTRFPQQMKVDYVRLYDKPYGRLVGPTTVNANEQGIVFVLQGGVSDNSYKWSVPTGATITSGGSSSAASIAVNFGTNSGYVTVVATSSRCSSTKTFTMPVLVDKGRI